MFQAEDAVRHLFRVASSLDSMVLGEPQILGQLKTAFREAVENRGTGAILNKLLHKSFSVAKRVRTETGIASHAVSISYAAVELARKISETWTAERCCWS
jgi:glutamyl-tRNA reductase